MRYGTLDDAGLIVSKLGIGEDAARTGEEHRLEPGQSDIGITMFDTSNKYGSGPR